MNTKIKKTLVWSARIIAIACAVAAAAVVLWRFEYFSSFMQVDNPVGAVPIFFAIVFVGGTVGLAFLPYKRAHIPIAVMLAVFVVLSAALFPNALRGNWWIQQKYSTKGESADISVYEPYKDGNKTAKLGETSELTLDSDLPVMDGALALYPVYAAIAETVYSEQAVTDEVMFTNTLRAYDGIIKGERDVIFVAGASKSQMDAAKAAGAELVFTPIGKEAFVFLVGKDNPIDDISYKQIKDIYSGKTAYWKTLGWAAGGKIVAYQRPDGSGSQTGIQSAMKSFGLPLIVPQPFTDKSLIGSNSLMQQISVEYKGVQPALGYSYKFFATEMYPNDGAKLLSVNGIAPTAENIRTGAYPYTGQFYAVTNGAPTGNTKRLIDWLLSPQGQRLIEKCGYAAIK